MSRYEAAKFLVKRKARKGHVCRSCGKPIDPKDEYYSESLGLMMKPPNVSLNSYCLNCGPKTGHRIEP